MTNLISVNNGNSYVTAQEAIDKVGMDVILNFIDLNSDAYAYAEYYFTGDTDAEWLELFLIANNGLIIG
jgi:hypothetical protein